MANNKVTRLARRQDIKKKLLDGWDTNALKCFIVNNYGFADRLAYREIRRARAYVGSLFTEGKDHLIASHLMRYELIYKELFGLGLRLLSMKALRQKEDMLGIGGNLTETSVRVNNLTVGGGVLDGFDRGLLPAVKRDRLSFLLDSVKPPPPS